MILQNMINYLLKPEGSRHNINHLGTTVKCIMLKMTNKGNITAVSFQTSNTRWDQKIFIIGGQKSN